MSSTCWHTATVRMAWCTQPNPTQAGLGNGEGLTLAAHENVRRDPNIVVVDEGVHALVW